MNLFLELHDLFLLLALHDTNMFTLNFIDEFRSNLLFQTIHEHLALGISLFRLTVNLSILIAERFNPSSRNLPLTRLRILFANLVKRFQALNLRVSDFTHDDLVRVIKDHWTVAVFNHFFLNVHDVEAGIRLLHDHLRNILVLVYSSEESVVGVMAVLFAQVWNILLGLLLSLHIFHVDRMSKGVWLISFVVLGIFELLHFFPRAMMIFGVFHIMLLGLTSDVISPRATPKRLIPKDDEARLRMLRRSLRWLRNVILMIWHRLIIHLVAHILFLMQVLFHALALWILEGLHLIVAFLILHHLIHWVLLNSLLLDLLDLLHARAFLRLGFGWFCS